MKKIESGDDPIRFNPCKKNASIGFAAQAVKKQRSRCWLLFSLETPVALLTAGC